MDERQEPGWSFSYEKPLHDVFPALHEAQSAWLSQIESLQALDRKTHEIVRMVVSVTARNAGGVQRHAQLATEVGASWDELVAAIVLTEPTFGVLASVEALPAARAGHEAGLGRVGDELDPETE